MKKYELRSLYSQQKTFKNFVVVVFATLMLVSCGSNNSNQGEVSQTQTKIHDDLSELTPAKSSVDAYKRSCYWANEGALILMNQRMLEGNALARLEGKLPVLGVEQSMDYVLRKGIPRSPAQWAMIKSFCDATGVFVVNQNW